MLPKCHENLILKNSYLLENTEKENLNSIPYEAIQSLLDNSSFAKVVETINTKEFKNLQQLFSNPDFQSTLQTISSLQKKFPCK